MPAVPYSAHQSASEVHASLRSSLAALDEARQCAVLWFSEVMRRRLYRGLGYSSMNQYAMQELGFSKTRTGDFMRLAQKLEELPAVREAVASGELGYTKAREIVTVATVDTQGPWLEAARGSRADLTHEVKRARRAAQTDPAQVELLPAKPTVVAPRELPVRLQVDLTPEQEARRLALVERLHKLGGIPTNRAELMLEALAALVESKEAPRGALAAGPSVMIHVHEEAATGVMTVQTDNGEREISQAEADRLRCDAVICRPGERNKATIRPAIRREVLARDHHQCQSPGCKRTRFLEVHHIRHRHNGGANHPDNLTTLCSACHRLWHQRRYEAAGQKVTP